MDNFIGLNIKYLLAKENMTQKQIAELFDSKQSTISSILTGRTEPNIMMLQKFSNHFKISIDDFINVNLESKKYADLSPVALKTKEPTAEYVTDKDKIIRAQEKTISVLEKQNALLEKTVDSLEAKLAKKAS